MERKPVKRNENIAKLSRDHHGSLMFCWKLRNGIKHGASTERMANYIRYFREQHFNPHFREEEEILFAPLHDEKVQHALDDHVKIKKMIDDILFSDSFDQKEELNILADTVDAHVRYEERILFPHLEKQLSGEQLETIGKQISDDAIKDNWDDEFWVKAVSKK